MFYLLPSVTGGLSEEVTPVLIPNTAVKLFSADDTRQGESRSLPVFYPISARIIGYAGAFFVRQTWHVFRRVRVPLRTLSVGTDCLRKGVRHEAESEGSK